MLYIFDSKAAGDPMLQGISRPGRDLVLRLRFKFLRFTIKI